MHRLRSWRLLALLLACLSGQVLAQGRLNFEPATGPVGTLVEGTASGLEPDTSYSFVWHYATADWDIVDGAFFGVTAEEEQALKLLTLRSNGSGAATFSFRVPAGYGYMHNTFVRNGSDTAARQGFVVHRPSRDEPFVGTGGHPDHRPHERHRLPLLRDGVAPHVRRGAYRLAERPHH